MRLKATIVHFAEWAGWLNIVDERVIRSYIKAANIGSANTCEDTQLVPVKEIDTKLIKNNDRVDRQIEIIKKSNTSLEEGERIVHQALNAKEMNLPESVHERIEAYAWGKAQERKHAASPSFVHEDTFLAMAAADKQTVSSRELKSKSGEWTIRLFPHGDDPNRGLAVLEVINELIYVLEGKKVTLSVGGKEVFSAPIQSGHAEKEIEDGFAEIDLNQPPHIKIE